MTDSVGVANAQVAARGQDPGSAKALLDLQVQGLKNGYSDAYGEQIGQMVLDGTISGDDARQMIAGAISKSNSLEAEGGATLKQVRLQTALA